MAAVIRHTAVWTGAVGLPGYTDFYHAVSDPISASAQSGHNAVALFFAEFAGYIPDGVYVTVDPAYQIIEATTGAVTGEGVVGTPSSGGVGSGGGGWSSQVGIMVEWLTGIYIAGRQLRGRTYLVPLANFADVDGTVKGDALSNMRALLTYIVNAPQEFMVWHRPVNGAGGSTHAITAGVIRDHAAVLRSRAR